MATTPSPPSSPLPDDPHAALLRDRRLLVALIGCGVAAFVVVTLVNFSGAAFTSSSRSPGNQFSAATMGLDLSEHGQVVDGDGMGPGDVRTGAQVVTNTGHRGALVLASRDRTGSTLLARTLQVTVKQTDPPIGGVLYDGALSDLDEVPLGTLAPQEARTYSITVTWPAGQTADALYGTTTDLDLVWRIETGP